MLTIASIWTVQSTRVYVLSVETVRSFLLRSEKGQGLVEYGLLVTLIALGAVSVTVLVGHGLRSDFRHVVRVLRRVRFL